MVFPVSIVRLAAAYMEVIIFTNPLWHSFSVGSRLNVLESNFLTVTLNPLRSASGSEGEGLAKAHGRDWMERQAEVNSYP